MKSVEDLSSTLFLFFMKFFGGPRSQLASKHKTQKTFSNKNVFGTRTTHTME